MLPCYFPSNELAQKNLFQPFAPSGKDVTNFDFLGPPQIQSRNSTHALPVRDTISLDA
jgi:hypothetical protein